MGSCTSVPASPSGSNTIQQMSDTFRVRQLDARYRKKAVMNLRISDTDLIIEAKGKRGQPELIASVSFNSYCLNSEKSVGVKGVTVGFVKGRKIPSEYKWGFSGVRNSKNDNI